MSDGIHPLRERLIAVDEAHDPVSNGPSQGRAPRWFCDCGAEAEAATALDATAAAYSHMADVNTAAVAAWLREEAAAIREDRDEPHWLQRSGAVSALVDAIDPPNPTVHYGGVHPSANVETRDVL